ncbi:MAG: aldehyde dehydrogenase EutE [FCB group bacterium]|nr:aldehyde dehydrogenase EutE [FCB group bacterium]
MAAKVAGLIRSGGQNPASAVSRMSVSEAVESGGAGVFGGIDPAVRAARKAHTEFMDQTLERRYEIIAKIREKMLEHAEDLARRAHDETGLGRVGDKVMKNRLVTEKTPGPEVLTPAANSGDRGLTLMEAAPFGVIGSITPVTNPTSTIICNTIGMLSAGNAVVFNVHPSARKVSIYTIELLNQAILEAGGPVNLVTTVSKPTIESAQELMTHPGVNLLVVTGGSGVVKAAMRSGKRAICAGPGNPPVVVDESADIENAARHIVEGASLDNNIICVLEKEIFVVESVADQLIAAFQRHDAVVLQPHEIAQLDKVIFTKTNGLRKPGVINKNLIGQSVQTILDKIHKTVDDGVRLAIAPVEAGHPLVWTEQMLPVIPLVRMPTADQAIDIAKEAEHGFRHTAIMHSKNLDNLSRMARVMDCSIFVKNGPSVAGLGYGGEGYCSFTIASPTGEGLTGPRAFTRERRCVLVDHFRIV